MSAPNASLRTAWHAVASAWPRDPLRPKLQFADAIRTAADRAFAASESPLTETQRWKANEAARAMQRLVQNRALEQVSHHSSRSQVDGPLSSPTATHTPTVPRHAADDQTRFVPETLPAHRRHDRARRARRGLQAARVVQAKVPLLLALPFFHLVVSSISLFLCPAMTTCIATPSYRHCPCRRSPCRLFTRVRPLRDRKPAQSCSSSPGSSSATRVAVKA
jgi:hypothetical protein